MTSARSPLARNNGRVFGPSANLTGRSNSPPSLPICRTAGPGVGGVVDASTIRVRYARVGGVEDSKAVAPRLEVQDWPITAIDDVDVAEEFGNQNGWILGLGGPPLSTSATGSDPSGNSTCKFVSN